MFIRLRTPHAAHRFAMIAFGIVRIPFLVSLSLYSVFERLLPDLHRASAAHDVHREDHNHEDGVHFSRVEPRGCKTALINQRVWICDTNAAWAIVDAKVAKLQNHGSSAIARADALSA